LSIENKSDDDTYISINDLKYLMFLKEKFDGSIKARGCADGRLHREHTAKADTSSLPVSLEAMMMSCTIETKENRYVAVTNIPGAFLLADMKEELDMLLEGEIAKLIVKLNPKLYRKFIWRNKNDKPLWETTGCIIVLEVIVRYP